MVIPRESGAKAGYPVRRGLSINFYRLWNTGSPAFAGDEVGRGGRPSAIGPLGLDSVSFSKSP
jgi:hypothetical protein